MEKENRELEQRDKGLLKETKKVRAEAEKMRMTEQEKVATSQLETPQKKTGILEKIKVSLKKMQEKVRIFRKKRRQKRYENGEVELPVFRVGPNKKGVIVLWVLMGASLIFGIYKNFTAIDKETIYETKVVETEVIDTNEVESFVERFAYLYYTWENDAESKREREDSLAAYMTDELVKVNIGAVTSECPTRSAVKNVRISEVNDIGAGDYEVRYFVEQQLRESGEKVASVKKNEVPVVATGSENEVPAGDAFKGTQTGETAEDKKQGEAEMGETETGEDVSAEQARTEQTGYGEYIPGQAVTTRMETIVDGDKIITVTIRGSFYMVVVHVDEAGNMVITKNPTMCGTPGRSAYVPKTYQTDGSIDVSVMEEIEEFLNTFFALYPSAAEKELAYYAKPGAMDVINADCVYDGIYNAAYYKEEGQVKVHVYVRYLDQTAKMAQISEYTLTLEKGDNWKIVETQ